VQGQQAPRLSHVPEYATSAGQEAIELAAVAGLILDPWQQAILIDSLGERDDGKWAAFEVGLCVPRQNGKNAIIEARELAGLFLFDEKLITHTAHQFDTSLEAFRRLLILLESAPELEQQIKRVSRSHGDEGIELKNGARVRFRTRTRGGGRGFSGDLMILDESMIIAEAAMAALIPTLSARPNPQLWYTGSAVDQMVHEHALPFTRLRDRAIGGEAERLYYAEYSIETPLDEITAAIEDDEEAWAQANPALGIRLSTEMIKAEQGALSPRDFAVERLGAGDWPALDEDVGDGITREMWHGCEDPGSVLVDPVRFAIDVTPDRMRAAIVAGGLNENGEPHVEVVAHQSGTAWLPAKLEDLQLRHDCGPIVIGARSPAFAMVAKLTELGIKYELVDGPSFARACGEFFDDVHEGKLRHLGTGELQAAALGAKKRASGDSFVWNRKSSTVDISPLCGATLAHHVACKERAKPKRSGRVVAA
jgi:hypothetical protein